MEGKKGISLAKRHLMIGWGFVIPATLLIVIFSFFPMFQAILLSLKKGVGAHITWNGIGNYARILKDKRFIQAIFNTLFYLVIQVPIMLGIALALASILNNKHLRFKGLFSLVQLPLYHIQ